MEVTAMTNPTRDDPRDRGRQGTWRWQWGYAQGGPGDDDRIDILETGTSHYIAHIWPRRSIAEAKARAESIIADHARAALTVKLATALELDADFVCHARGHVDDYDDWSTCAHPDCVSRRALLAEVRAAGEAMGTEENPPKIT